jgi:mannose-1-phosphate guanylyltransferase
VFVVVKAHEKFYRRELADVEPAQLVVQPANKGTTAAVICSLLRITGLAGDPVVAFFPTDHYYSNEAHFITSVEQAIRVALNHSDTLVVLGAKADRAEVDYGWIEPSTRFESRFTSALHRVSRVWEKPSYATASALLAAGCLWNTFVMIGRASVFLAMLDNTVTPGLSRALMAARRCAGEVSTLTAQDYLWEKLTEGDFSRQVLSTNTEKLSVLQIGDVGWSDLGTPERARAAIAGLRFESTTLPALSNRHFGQLQAGNRK